MKLHYYPETDSLYIELRDVASVETREVASEVNGDFDGDGNLVGVDIDRASGKLELRSLETSALRFASLTTV